MDRVLEDMDLFTNAYPLCYHKWKANEMKKAWLDGRRGETSYKLMMVMFG